MTLTLRCIAPTNTSTRFVVAPTTKMNTNYRVSANQARNYGMKGLGIIASSYPEGPAPPAPSTFTPVKNIFPVDYYADQAFIIIYEAIHDKIYEVIEAQFPSPHFHFSFTAFRLGFDAKQYKNPITIQVVISRVRGNWRLLETSVEEEKAYVIISKTLQLLADRDLEGIPIDVCRALTDNLSERALMEESSRTTKLIDGNPQVYNSTARRPGLSIGPAETEKKHTVGTLTCFIKHTEKGKTEGFALTCRHVIDPDNSLSPIGGISKNINKLISTHKHIQVDCPQHGDHSNTVTAIEGLIESTANRIEMFGKALGRTNTSLTDLRSTLVNAKQYDIRLGQVCATSGFNRLLPPLPAHFPFQGSSVGKPTGRADWILVELTNHTIPLENKHVPSTIEFDSFHTTTFNGAGGDFVRAANKALAFGPCFKPVRNDLVPGEVVFKPRSRTTTSWVGGTFNAIRSTQSDGRRGTRELCLLSLTPDGCVSAPGDSGSIVVDKEFRPLGFLWGGYKHEFASCQRDITHVSMFCSVFRDIEICNGWEEGSVTMA